MGQSILEQLREQTRPAHAALEAQALLQRLLSSQLTEREYGQLLQSMLAFYQSLESELIPATAALLARHPDPDYRYLPRAPLLANDCRALGFDSRDVNHSPVSPRLDGSGVYLLGVLYVIEGSSQGGRLIARHLDHTLGIKQNSGASFFNIHRWDNSWTAFRQWLSRDLAYHYQDDIKKMIKGANTTFSTLHSHLDQWQVLTHEQ
ncbi:MAG: biliverdin-producing heme oxygenase [Pseudomonadota bacterium]